MVNNSGMAEPTLVCCEPTKTDKSSIKSGTTTDVPGALCLLATSLRQITHLKEHVNQG